MNSRQRNMVLIGGVILTFILCYLFAFSKTVEQRRTYLNLKQQETLFEDIPRQFSILNQKIQHYDQLLKKYRLSDTSLQNNLLKTINEQAASLDLQVIRFDEPHVVQKEGNPLNTYRFTLEGPFEALLQLVHFLEQQTRYGEVINLHFKKKKNYQNGKSFLQMEVFVQNRG
ncbi:hypothetical protein ACJD0Z_04225 [Flavobacteriaceae bacterium M23B6Z8]